MVAIKPLKSKGFAVGKAQTRRLGFFVLIKFFKKIDFFKVTAAIVAAVFFWNQIVWAGDIAVSALDNLNDNQAQTFAPAYLQKQNTLHKDIIDQKQAIEEFGVNQTALTTSGAIEPPAEEKLDLKGPIGGSSGEAVVATASYIEPSASVNGGSPAIPDPGAIISVTTQAGDVVHYIGSEIDYIECLDGSTLRNLHFGGDGNLLDAYISYQDGRTFTVVNGLITSMEYPDHSVVTYTYIGIPGNITETIVIGLGKTAYYDASGKLTRVEFDNGRLAEYDSGILASVHDIDGHEYIYDTAEIQNGDVAEYMTSLQTIVDSSGVAYSIENNNVTSVGINGFTLSDFDLDSGGSVVNGTVTYADNSRVLIENGRIRKVTSGTGVSTRYVYSGESVQQAIYSVAAGDTVYLHAGIYHEHIILSNGVNLVGEDNASTAIHGDYTSRSHVIRALGNNRIEGITISGSGPYASVPSSAVRIEGSNVSIRNNRIVDNRDYGLHIWSGDNILIEKNLFKDNSLGVQLPNSGTTIQYNTFVNNGISINVLNGPATVIRNNIVTGSTFQSIYEFSWGAYSSGQPASGYAIVEGNILYSNRESGGYYCRCLPPAIISQTLGNRITNPLFVNPAAGNYSIPENSPAYSKGAFLPQALGDSLDSAAGPDLKPAVNTVSDTGITAPIPMPGDMFNASGRLIATYDFMNIPYFDTIRYDSGSNIVEVRNPNGVIEYYREQPELPETGSLDILLNSPVNLLLLAAHQSDINHIFDNYRALNDLGLSKIDYITMMEDGGFIITNYWLSGNKRSEAFVGSGLEWNSTVLYYDDAVLKKYTERLAVMNHAEPGNIIYKEYDPSGALVGLIFDDPKLMITGHQNVNYISEDYAVAKDDFTGDIFTFKKYGNKYRINTFVSADGTLRLWSYDGAGEVLQHSSEALNGATSIYNERNQIQELLAPNGTFIKGTNLAWINYGHDLGTLPDSQYHIGFSSEEQIGKLYEKLSSRRGETVRLFLFCDLRSGITFDASGNPIGFTDKVYDDMRALLGAAKAFGIKLLPTLFDYGLADGKSIENGYATGEHADLINDPVKTEKLLDIFDPFLAEFAADPSIYAWDIINEPEYATAVQMTKLRLFVRGFVDLVHAKASLSLVTVGSRNRQDMVTNWTGLGLDLYQYHYYDSMESSCPLAHQASDIGLDKPIIAGELEPTSIDHKLDVLYSNNYAGGLFWEDDYYLLTDEARAAIEDWFSGTLTAYIYYSSGRKKAETFNNGTVHLFEDTEICADGNGRLIRELYMTGAYKVYAYYDTTENVRSIDFFMPNNSLFMEEEYDAEGELSSSKEYYSGGSIKTIRMEDDSWFDYDETGTVIRRGERVNGIDITYDALGRIIKIKDSNYEEERRYVLIGDNIEYTLALHDNIVRTIKDGYYAGADLISRDSQASAPSTLSVTYDDNVVVGYINDQVQYLSVAGGYMNFYNADGISYQNSSSGDLYYFENGYLSRIATPGGNVYNFAKTIGTGSKITIELLDAVIDGQRILSSNPSIKTLINGEIPNVKFVYDALNNIEEVVTSEFCRIFFSGGLISKTVTPDGALVSYSFHTDPLSGEIDNLAMTENNIIRTFDVHGKLVSVAFDDGTGSPITLSYDDEILQRVETPDGVLDNMELNPQGDFERVRLVKPDGLEYFFAGGTLESFLNSLNAEYELDSQTGEITRIIQRDTQEAFTVSYDTERPDGKNIITFTSETKATSYIFEDGFLKQVSDPSGMRVDYTYEVYGNGFRTRQIRISYANNTNTTYTYTYLSNQTIVTDDIGNMRTFNQNNRLLKLETPYGETYDYVYDTNSSGEPITIVNYSKKDRGGGLVIEYFKGEIKKVTRPDGSWLDNIEFDQFTQKLSRFSYHTADNKHRNVIVSGSFIQFELADQTRLIFYKDKLVALASSQGVVPLYDMNELEDLIYTRDPSDQQGTPSGNPDVAASSWQHQTYQDTQAIRFVERDYTNQQWVVNIDLRTNSPNYSKGEMFLDLRYDIPGLEWQAPIDMRGKTISFLFKLDPSFQQNPDYLSNIQVFAKDVNWKTQYGTKVSMSASSGWIEVALIPAEGSINAGYTDSGFDPSSIVMIGLRITQPDNAPNNLNYLGKVFIKHNILPDLFANLNNATNPLDSLYYDLGVTRDVDLTGGGSQSDQELFLEAFADSLANGPSDSVMESMLRQVNWNVEKESAQIMGISSLYRDTYTGEIAMNANLVTNSTTGLKEGQVYFDLTKDVPSLGWGSSLNFTSRPIRMLIKVPAGMIGPPNAPNGARIFVKDVNNGYQYGTWVNLKEADKWYEIELTPTFGSVPMGVTGPGFDPSKIVKIGINVTTQAESNTNFSGEIRAKFLPQPGDANLGTTIRMPLWMDLRNIKEYLIDEDGNYIRVPRVTSLASAYFNYVFNKGSGTPPTANFDALEMSNTVWQSQKSGQLADGESRDTQSNVYWNSAGDTLIYNLPDNSRELFLDLKWNCWVPGKNWQDSIDMTTQAITFYVRPQNTTDAKFSISAFAKSVVIGPPTETWVTECSEIVTSDGFGAWTEVTLMPLPVDFNSGFVETLFDPTSIRAMGIKINKISGTYTGPLEIKYEVNPVDLGLTGLGDSGTLPPNPVWVNQRELGQYLIDNNIALYGEFGILSEINQLVAEVPDYRLPSDFAAFTVYDEDFNTVSITKPNGTTTYFDDNKIDYIAFADDSVFIDYGYDQDGNLISATLKNARERLDAAFEEAIADINKKTADALIVLAEQQALITEDFMITVNAHRSEFARQRASLEAQRYVEIEHSFLWWSWTERIEVPGVTAAIAQVNAAETAYNLSVAEELASLGSAIETKKSEIEAERNKVEASYEWQKAKMLAGIMHEEFFPIIHYYYKNILGREVDEAELRAAFKRIDENISFAGIFVDDIIDAEDLILSLKAMQQNPMYTLLSSSLKNIISGFVQGAQVTSDTKETLTKDLDVILQDYGLYARLLTYYGSQSALNALLSDATRQYRDGLTYLSTPVAALTSAQKNGIQWLNRYILQDICQGILKKNKATPVLNVAALKIELTASNEHTLSAGFKSDVIVFIKNFFERYLDPLESRTLLLDELGLSENEAINITGAFLSVLYGWLDGQDLHFGKSAFGALEKMLEGSGIASVDMDGIAKEALLIDILLGITGPLSDDKIAISMFTMRKVATLHGLACENVRLDYSDIMGLTKPFVTLINGYHYITVLSVTQDEVRYWDSNIGTSGGEVTLGKKDFEDNWQGNVITSEDVQNKEHITDAAARKIKGAFFWFIPAILYFCFQAFTAIVTVAMSIVTAVIVPLVTLISNVAAVLVNAFAGIGNLLAFAGKAFLGALGLGGGAAAAAGGAVTTTGTYLGSLVTSAATTAIKIGVAYGTSVGLEALGVDPAVTGIISALVTGGVDGFMSGHGVVEIFKSAVQYGATAGMSLLGQYFDFDPIITNIMSMATSALVGNIGTPPEQFSAALKLIARNVVTELAYYGVQQLGSYLGVDPRISYLAGVGIRSSINAGLTHEFKPDEMWGGIQSGLLQGVTSVGLQWAYDEIGVNPLFGAMTANAIGAAFEAILNKQNIFLNIGKQAGEGIFSLFTLGDYGDNPWSQAVYISQVLDFSRIVQEQGLLVALETYATSIFHQQAINLIVKDGGIYDMLTNRAEVFTDANGIQRKRLYADSDRNYYIDINMANNAIIEKKDRINGVDVITKQQYGIDGNGKLVLLGRTVEEVYSDNQTKISTYDYKNNLTLMEIFDKDGNVAFAISPLPGQSSISLKDGSVYSCVIKDIKNTVDFTFENGKMAYTSVDAFGADATPEPTYARDPNKSNLENAELYLDSMMQDYNYRLSGEEIFGASGWEVAMRALLLTSSKFQITYGNEASLLQSSLSESERQTFDEYATFLMDSVINPHNYNYIPMAEELAMWMSLQSPITPGSPYGFSLTVIHGMCLPGKGSGFDTTWADKIRDVKVGGKNFVLTVDTWNRKGMEDDLDTGMYEYMRYPEKRRSILNIVKQDIRLGWEKAQEQGIPFDVAAHSFGTVIVYEALGELRTEMPNMQVRNVFLMGSPLAYFVDTEKVVYDQSAFNKVTNVVNIYNPNDGMNLLRAGAVGAIAQNPLLRILIQSDAALGDKPLSRDLKPLFSIINDYKTDVSHGAMWQDPKILRIVEESGIFTN